MTRFSASNPPSTSLAAAVTNLAKTITVPSGSHAAMGRPARVILGSNEIVDITAVTTGSPETWTVTRGVDTSVAQAHDVDAVVERVFTLDEILYSPGVASITIPTGTSTYTPDASVKYHRLTLGGSTTLTIAAPVRTDRLPEPGDELRFTFQITATALSTQPAWHACYRRYNQGTATQGTVTLTKDTLTGMSFFYRGGGTAGTAAWVRQH